MSRAEQVAIVGGGVSGLTTAILLQVNNYRTFLYTKQRPSHEPDIVRTPEFASLHAAASILPHSVSSPHLARWTAISQEFFRALTFRASAGVRTQVHYEIFEESAVDRPPYADAVDGFEMLDASAFAKSGTPQRPGAGDLVGWRFNAFFCEVPEYLRYLYDFYQAIGGRVIDVTGPGPLAFYLDEGFKYVINCTGVGAHGLLNDADRAPEFRSRFADAHVQSWDEEFEPLADPWPPKLIRGHYLRVDIKELFPGPTGQFFSYNYKPVSEVYSTASGHPADVYCYPRSDAWILGGSRQEGRLDPDGRWSWEWTVGPETVLRRDEDGEELGFPSPILELNSELLIGLTEGRLDVMKMLREDPGTVSPGVGYRFVRDSPTDSIRLSVSEITDLAVPPTSELSSRFVLHNYGHGGSGFTLSWGCAMGILARLDHLVGVDNREAAYPLRQKFVLGHNATRLLLADLSARLLREPL